VIERLLTKLVSSNSQEALTLRSNLSRSEAQKRPETCVGRPAQWALPHLGGVVAALLMVFGLVAGGAQYATATEREYASVLAPTIFPQKSWGNAMQQAALALPDLMIIYGSSELRTGGQYDPGTLFNTYPTGFNVFSVGLHGAGALSMLQEVAASGPALRGKKVAVIVSPFFFLQPMDPSQWYDFNFSDLNANELAFNTALSLDARQAAATRMLQYPRMLAGDPVLRFALERLNDKSPFDLALYYAALPLGQIHIQVLRLQDHWEILNYLRAQPQLDPDVSIKPARIDWDALVGQATDEEAKHVTGNPFGIDDLYWKRNKELLMAQKNDLTDDKFRSILQTSLEWGDLDLLLRSLKELGAEPLLMTVPLLGRYYDFRGVTAQGRRTFYDMFRAAAKPYGIPVITFEDREYDALFFQDTADHPSPVGWVYYDRALDDFYHGKFH
jgi:D-alanine transfer protein